MIHIFGKENQTSGLTIKTGTFSIVEKSSESIIFHVITGESEVLYRNKRVVLSDNNLFILKAGEHVEICSKEKESYILIYSISSQLLGSIVNLDFYTFENKKIGLEETKGKELCNQSNKLIQYLRKNSNQVDFHVFGLAAEFIHILTTHFMRESNRKVDTRMQKIVNYIEENYKQLITLDVIAEHFDLAPAYFSRYFKRQLGIGYIEYLTNYRLEKVINRLIISDDKISEIALEEGFTNLNSFNKKFKEKYGCSPREYKNNFDIKKSIERSERENNHSNDDGTTFIDTNKIIISSGKVIKKNRKVWKKILNIGSAPDLLQHDLREHVKFLKEKLEFTYLRFWNMFTKSMDIDPTITRNYNFDKIDSVLDFLMYEDILPYIELRYKVNMSQSSSFQNSSQDDYRQRNVPSMPTFLPVNDRVFTT